MADLDFNDWLKFGVGRGWVTEPFCSAHDGVPLVASDPDEDELGDVCMFCIRLIPDAIER